jgi:beta-phosphoglucomutase-like phosphatase (HAD superfamily)
LPYALVTNNSRAAIEASVGRHGLIERFKVVVCGGEAARGKPAPDPFLLAAERLGVDPADCLALEDSHNGVRSAHAAGMMTIMVPDMLDATEEMRDLALSVEDTLHDVRALLTSSPP